MNVSLYNTKKNKMLVLTFVILHNCFCKYKQKLVKTHIIENEGYFK